MAASYSQSKGRERTGSFVKLDKSVINRPEFYNLSTRATKLLIDMLSFYNGYNNGDICITWRFMKARGWKSKDTLNDARKDLLRTGFIITSRYGGRNLSSLYALTFNPIDECKGKLDIQPTATAPNHWKKNS